MREYGVERTVCEEECKAATANTRTPAWVELAGLRLRSSPWQRDSRWSDRTERTRAIATPFTGYASRLHLQPEMTEQVIGVVSVQ